MRDYPQIAMYRPCNAIVVATFTASVVLCGSAIAAGSSKLSYEDIVKAGESSSVTVVVRRPAAFSVNLKAPTAGRTRLYLEGSAAPRGGPLIDTKSGGCEGAAGTWSCSGSYQALPKGTYRFRMRFSGGSTAYLRLTVRW